MRAIILAIALLGACKYEALPSLSGGGDDAGGGDGGGGGSDACVGLQCQVIQCNGTHTSLSGIVTMPNGNTPLPQAVVYVPNTRPDPLVPGASCTRCQPLSGNPIAQTRPDAAGHFMLLDVPSGDNIPLVIVSGKWRRQIVIPRVEECVNTMVATSETHMPRNQTEGDMPRIAVSTGAADALECLLRKIGVADTEFGTKSSMRAIHLYAPSVASGARMGSFGSFAASESALWNSPANLMPYDAVLLSCEGAQNPGAKPQPALDAMKAYADAGGRVFASHYHNIWIDGESGVPSHAPQVWPVIGVFPADGNPPAGDAFVDMSHPAGAAFSAYMQATTGTSMGRIAMEPGSGRNSVTSIDPVRATQMVYWPPPVNAPQNFTFTTPNEAPASQRCGRVAFSDMHVSSSSTSQPTTPFPQSCGAMPMIPQELALAYLLFDLQTCVGP